MSLQTLIVLGRAGARWGLDRAGVRGVTRQGTGFAIATEFGPARADIVYETAAHLTVQPPGVVLAHFWPSHCVGVAVHEGVPVVVVSPDALPAPLCPEGEEKIHESTQ